LSELLGLEGGPGVVLIRALDFQRFAHAFDLPLEPRPESARDWILVPDESDALADRGVQRAALSLGLNTWISDGINQFEHEPSYRIFLVVIGCATELRLEIETHCPICGATPPPTAMVISSGVTCATNILRSLGCSLLGSATGVMSPCAMSFCQSYEYLRARSA